MSFLKEGEIRRRKKCSERLKELDRKTFDQLVTGKYMTNFIAHRMAESLDSFLSGVQFMYDDLGN
jgi:predicted ATP-dependent serine protease